MLARDLMTPDPKVVTAGDPLANAAIIMRDMDVGSVPVVDDLAHMHPVGVITDRDIVLRCVAERHGDACRVRDHMTYGPLAAVGATSLASEAILKMKANQVRRVLVTENGRLVGIIAQADLALKEGPLAPLVVEQVLERVSAPARQA